jgi:hypothetical protein
MIKTIPFAASCFAMASGAYAYSMASNAETADKAINVGIVAVIAAIGSQILPHIVIVARVWADDRRNARNMENLERERLDVSMRLANDLQHARAQINQLKDAALLAEGLREQLELTQSRYEEALRLLGERQEVIAEKVNEHSEGIKANSASVISIVKNLPPEIRPEGPDPSDPLPLPQFDPLPNVPNPVKRKGDAPK